MRRFAGLLFLAIVAFFAASAGASLCGVASTGSALAQDGPPADEIQRRVQWLRELPRDEKANLKAALEKFRALPSAERERLRTKAAKIGPERLDGLSGRDIRALKKSRVSLDAEVDEVMKLLGRERLDAMSPDERAYIRAEALRGFQRQVQRKLLGLELSIRFDRLTSEERRAATRDAVRRAIADRETRLPDDERSRILALPPKDQAVERERLFAAFRMDQTLLFSRIFDRFRLQKFLDLPAEARAAEIRKWQEKTRWHELAHVLKEELAIGDDVRRELAALGPAEWARVMYEFRQTENVALTDRRLRMETMIHRLAGERALDTSPREPRVPPYIRALRERRLLSSAAPRPPAQDSEDRR